MAKLSKIYNCSGGPDIRRFGWCTKQQVCCWNCRATKTCYLEKCKLEPGTCSNLLISLGVE